MGQRILTVNLRANPRVVIVLPFLKEEVNLLTIILCIMLAILLAMHDDNDYDFLIGCGAIFINFVISFFKTI